MCSTEEEGKKQKRLSLLQIEKRTHITDAHAQEKPTTTTKKKKKNAIESYCFITKPTVVLPNLREDDEEGKQKERFLVKRRAERKKPVCIHLEMTEVISEYPSRKRTWAVADRSYSTADRR